VALVTDRKPNEPVVLVIPPSPDDVVVKIIPTKLKGKRVRLAIAAPPHVRIRPPIDRPRPE
jgi:sRNA-binding carbon storage regulator CsrA